MSLVVNKIDQMVAECESRIAEVKRQLRVLEAELDGYKAARATLQEAGIGRRKIDDEGPLRALSDNWRKILLRIGEAGATGMSIDSVERYQNELGYGINRNTIRSQLSVYNSKGFLDRIGGGQYSLTSLGRAVANQATKTESSVIRLGMNRFAESQVGRSDSNPTPTGFTGIVGSSVVTSTLAAPQVSEPSKTDPSTFRSGRPWEDGE